MNRPSRIKILYNEVRETLGAEISPKEALQLAAHLVDIADGRDSIKGAQITEQRDTFDELPIDQALADGGWKVLNREREIVRAVFDGGDNYSQHHSQYQPIKMDVAA